MEMNKDFNRIQNDAIDMKDREIDKGDPIQKYRDKEYTKPLIRKYLSLPRNKPKTPNVYIEKEQIYDNLRKTDTEQLTLKHNFIK